jgi:hypothetical protein
MIPAFFPKGGVRQFFACPVFECATLKWDVRKMISAPVGSQSARMNKYSVVLYRSPGTKF